MAASNVTGFQGQGTNDDAAESSLVFILSHHGRDGSWWSTQRETSCVFRDRALTFVNLVPILYLADLAKTTLLYQNVPTPGPCQNQSNKRRVPHAGASRELKPQKPQVSQIVKDASKNTPTALHPLKLFKFVTANLLVALAPNYHAATAEPTRGPHSDVLGLASGHKDMAFLALVPEAKTLAWTSDQATWCNWRSQPTQKLILAAVGSAGNYASGQLIVHHCSPNARLIGSAMTLGKNFQQVSHTVNDENYVVQDERTE
ncbi:hypothetical protein C8R45DRAFT_925445 [Mycena sanguinolenta]|nr:hypothetical protein C8R45DRAFT_925445 [Mycena sanguinolenta]